MADFIDHYSDKQAEKIEQQIGFKYKEASIAIKKKLAAFEKKHKAKDKAMKAKVKSGEITQAQYEQWMLGQVFQGEYWQQKLDDIVKVYVDADKKSHELVHDANVNVFTEASNYTAYDITKAIGGGVNFHVYDQYATRRLLASTPKLLPEWKIDEQKDYTWNKRLVRNCIVHGIIEGKSVPEVAGSLSKELAASNANRMNMFARTAITGAQNAGRIERMHEAKEQGIKVRKKWLATLDDRTRDSHAYLDGQEVNIDDDFVTEDGRKIGYPGDPNADADLVFNCRCTLMYVYPKYSEMSHGQRRDSEGNTMADMSYIEWKKSKEEGKLDTLSDAKLKLYNAQKDLFGIDMSYAYHGIWKDDVTIADYEAKKGSIQAKRDYFNDKLQQAISNGDTAAEQKFQNLLTELYGFEEQGEKYLQSKQTIEDAKAEIADITKEYSLPNHPIPKDEPEIQPKQETKKGPFTPDAYSQARKDAAIWTSSKRQLDGELREGTGKVWRTASKEEKDAIYDYTQSYHKFNEPLRGIEYGTNRYLGVGNTDLGAGMHHNGKQLNAMTDIIEKTTYEKDIWLQRGCDYGGMDKFLGIDESLLRYGTQEQLEQALLGKTITEYGFFSCGSTKGAGFSHKNVIFNVYAPQGTKMMYVEPFSAFGCGDMRSWDGTSKQYDFGTELETILQQGTDFRITKVEKTGDHLYIDIEVIAQDKRQRWKG